MWNRRRLFAFFFSGVLLSVPLAGSFVLLVASGILPIQRLLAASPAMSVPTTPRPAPVFGWFNGCPAEGDAEDIELNRRKNRTDEAAWQPVDLAAMLSLTWSKAVEG